MADMITSMSIVERQCVCRWRLLELGKVLYVDDLGVVSLHRQYRQVIDLISYLLEIEDKDVLLIKYL